MSLLVDLLELGDPGLAPPPYAIDVVIIHVPSGWIGETAHFPSLKVLPEMWMQSVADSAMGLPEVVGGHCHGDDDERSKGNWNLGMDGLILGKGQGGLPQTGFGSLKFPMGAIKNNGQNLGKAFDRGAAISTDQILKEAIRDPILGIGSGGTVHEKLTMNSGQIPGNAFDLAKVLNLTMNSSQILGKVFDWDAAINSALLEAYGRGITGASIGNYHGQFLLGIALWGTFKEKLTMNMGQIGAGALDWNAAINSGTDFLEAWGIMNSGQNLDRDAAINSGDLKAYDRGTTGAGTGNYHGHSSIEIALSMNMFGGSAFAGDPVAWAIVFLTSCGFTFSCAYP